MKSPIRYAGGKTKAIKQISPFLEPYDKIISPFIGGGSIELHMAEKGKRIYGFDVFEPLVNFWKVLLTQPEELYKQLKELQPTPDNYIYIKQILMKWEVSQKMFEKWKTDYYSMDDHIDLDPITAASYFYFNHNTSYGPNYLGWGSKVYLNQSKWNKMCLYIKNFEQENLLVEYNTFEDTILNNSKEFLYLDPPYYLEKSQTNKMFAGIYPSRNFPVYHNDFDHIKLRNLLYQHKGDFVLSYNDCDQIRELYKDFEFHFPKWNYSMNHMKSKESHEILIVKK